MCHDRAKRGGVLRMGDRGKGGVRREVVGRGNGVLFAARAVCGRFRFPAARLCFSGGRFGFPAAVKKICTR